MTWLEKLYENPEWLQRFLLEFADSYLPSSKNFAICIDELKIFEELGLKFRFNCLDGDCLHCGLNFLTDPKIYEFTTREVDDNG